LLFCSTLVRSSHSFRHYLAFRLCPCLKFTQLQTLTRFFDSTLSEVHTTSDTNLLFRLDLVRSSHNFGHYLAFSTHPCPKITLLRTPTYFFHLPLSEVHTTSDTISPIRLDLVRSSRSFRHNLAISNCPCLKFTQLRTLIRFFDPPLSEVHTASDTRPLFQVGLVQS